MWQTFFSDESGAVTVDWVVLTAAIVGLGLAAGAVVATGVGDLSNQTADAVEEIDPSEPWFRRGGEILAAFGLDVGLADGRHAGGNSRAPDGVRITRGGMFDPNSNHFNGADVDDSVYLNAGGTATFDIGEGYDSSASYTASLDMGLRSDRHGRDGTNYTATLYAGSTAIGSMDSRNGGDQLGARGTMNTFTFNSDAGNPSLDGQALTMRVTTSDGRQMQVDNVSVTRN